jgi:hypothetical protein
MSQLVAGALLYAVGGATGDTGLVGGQENEVA